MSEQENTQVEETPKPKLSKVLRGISQLLLSGLYTGAHSQILFESVGILEVLANAEEAKEIAAEPKLEVVPDPVEEPIEVMNAVEPAADPVEEPKEELGAVNVEDGV